MQLLIGNEVLDISIQKAHQDQGHLFIRHAKVQLHSPICVPFVLSGFNRNSLVCFECAVHQASTEFLMYMYALR